MKRAPVFDGGEDTQPINISPLIDVIFILLIFFIVAAVFSESSAVEADVPTSSGSAQAAMGSVHIYVDKNGSVRAGDSAFGVDSGDASALERYLGKFVDGKTSVVIHANAGMPVGMLVRVMDAVRLHGNGEIFIETKRK